MKNEKKKERETVIYVRKSLYISNQWTHSQRKDWTYSKGLVNKMQLRVLTENARCICSCN